MAAETISTFFIDESTPSTCNQGICGISYIREEEIKNAYYQLFGKNSDYRRGNFEVINCASTYSWSAANNRYEAKIPDGCGGAVSEFSINQLYKAKEIKQGDISKIELTEGVAFVKGNEGYYKDINYKEFVEPVVEGVNVLEKSPEKYSQYKYTFVKDNDGIYVFTSVEKIK